MFFLGHFAIAEPDERLDGLRLDRVFSSGSFSRKTWY
jgi:hypothetical protein